MAHLFGLVGKHIGYSQSPTLFGQLFALAGLEASYQLFDLENLEEVHAVFARKPVGLNVTQPYKRAILPFLDELDPTAEAVGAVNTIAFDQEKRIGYNTDVPGFEKAILPFLPQAADKALLIGSGGAARAAQYVLQRLGISTRVVSRSPSADQIAYAALTVHELAQYSIIVQCTPLGSARYPGQIPPIPYAGIHNEQLAFDMIYSPATTPFLAEAHRQGATVINGKTMLQYQAEAAWSIWANLNFS